MRKLFTLACLLLLTSVCSSAFTQELPHPSALVLTTTNTAKIAHAQAAAAGTAANVERAVSSYDSRPVLSPLGWIGVGTAATGLVLFGSSFIDARVADVDGPKKGALYRRATGAAAAIIGGGLVLLDLNGERTRSRLYIKFNSDGMPLLRWQTRF